MIDFSGKQLQKVIMALGSSSNFLQLLPVNSISMCAVNPVVGHNRAFLFISLLYRIRFSAIAKC